MPFDGSRFEPPPPPRADPPPRRRAEGVLVWTIAVLAFAALLLPVSADGLIDLVRYIAG